MHHISKVTDVITFPARTAVGAARFGIRTTGRVLGWAVEQVAAAASDRGSSAPPAPVTTPAAPAAPAAPVDSDAESATPAVDPMLGTRTPPAATAAAGTTAEKAAPRKKVPAGQVPLKSAPTPSLTPALEAFDEAHEADDEPAAPAVRKAPAKKAAAKKAPAKKAAATKAAAKKAPARKAPSKQAAVLAPALGLSEDEVAEVVGDDPAER